MRFKYVHYKGRNYRSIFEKWHEILQWYEDAHSDDLPYWYLERTNVGHLALAVYQLNGFPLQEFSCSKGRGALNSVGRADLYISIPGSSSTRERGYECNLEAKQVWCSLTLNAQVENLIENKLNEAVRDCRNLTDKYWMTDTGLGLLFVLPYGTVRDYDQLRVRDKLLHFSDDLTSCAKALDASFIALHYADPKVSIKLCRAGGFEWCPGIAAIGKIAR